MWPNLHFPVICSHLLNNFLMENIIFCAVDIIPCVIFSRLQLFCWRKSFSCKCYWKSNCKQFSLLSNTKKLWKRRRKTWINAWCCLLKIFIKLNIFEHFSKYGKWLYAKHLCFRYGMHESYENYLFCKSTSRNKGLFTADQVS